MKSSICRIGAAAMLVAFAIPVLAFTGRTGWSAWRVTPELWMGMAPSTSDVVLLRQVALLVPGDASYAAFMAGAMVERAFGSPDPAARAALLRVAGDRADRARELMPSNPRHWLLAGSIAITRARLPQSTAAERAQQARLAANHMREARKLFPNSSLIHQQTGLAMLRGWTVLDAAARGETLVALRSAASRDPSRIAANLVALRGSLGLETTIELIARTTPDSGEAWFATARQLEHWYRNSTDAKTIQRLSQEILNAHGEAVERGGLRADHVKAWEGAWQRLATDDGRAFLAAAQAVQRRHPRRPRAWLALASALLAAVDVEGAASALDRAVGLARELEHRAEESRVSNDLSLALQFRANLAFGAREFEVALADYVELTQLEPRGTTWWIGKARSLDAVDRPDEALRAYEAAVRWAPRSIEARATLADAYLARFEFLRAITQWRAIVGLRNEDTRFRLRIARTYDKLGLGDQAIRYYSEVLDRDPENGAARREMNLLLGVKR